MRVAISLGSGVNENAARYYEESKKWKRKLAGIAKGEAELSRKILATESAAKATVGKVKRKRDRKWFEKFHWFFTSEGFLVLAGRDAKSNELLVNKYMSEGDFYFHADIHGAAHAVLKSAADGITTVAGEPGETSFAEAARFVAVRSSAWREKLPGIDVYSAKPGQVTKHAPSGESVGQGAFMIYGERRWFKKTPLDFAIGISTINGLPQIFSGPESAVKSKADFFCRVEFGDDSKGDAAKKVAKVFSSMLRGKFHGFEFDLDEIVSLLPSGGMKIVFPHG